MDILRKELNAIYESQHLDSEELNPLESERSKLLAEGIVRVGDGCAVVTDASSDRSYLYIGSLGLLLGIVKSCPYAGEYGSSDEDCIYSRIHPEDLVEKRLLEYEFFRYIDSLSGKEKVKYQATCRIRMKDTEEKYLMVDNTTQVIFPSPGGKIWLILCTYQLSSDQKRRGDINPVIKDTKSGRITPLSLSERRKDVLSSREKEILLLIKEGKASKQIADILGISVHTVNRHRQNIIEKLSVGNSIEAITAAESMNLL
ncbi:MAG: helix-turn-helix transcriptional regulator [Muribaculaceae bacterium]|nr:helix-turn-helix transcriptional regulator [Muribaculaceae bacterium]